MKALLFAAAVFIGCFNDMGEQPGAASLAGATLIKQARVTGRSAAFVIVVPSGESYAFHFRQSGRSTLDTTLTFP